MDSEQIGITVGLVVAASLALQTALGPAMASIVEAIKATGRAPAGSAGLISLAIGTGLGAAAGVLASAQTQSLNPLWIGVGAFAGLIGLGAGGVRSHLVVQGYQQQAAHGDAGKAVVNAEREPATANPTTAQSSPNIALIDAATKEGGEGVRKGKHLLPADADRNGAKMGSRSPRRSSGSRRRRLRAVSGVVRTDHAEETGTNVPVNPHRWPRAAMMHGHRIGVVLSGSSGAAERSADRDGAGVRWL